MRWAVMAATALVACTVGAPAVAAKLYKCVDAQGHVTMSDHPCPVIAAAPTPPPAAPPCPLTAEQSRSAVRFETQFLSRYPDEASYRSAATTDLKSVVTRLRSAASHLGDLKQERKGIDDELEFYCRKPVPVSLARGNGPTCFKPVPVDLSRRLDASEAKFAAMTDVFHAIENDVAALVGKYQCEHTQFEAIWSGGAPGSSACMPACKAGG